MGALAGEAAGEVAGAAAGGVAGAAAGEVAAGAAAEAATGAAAGAAAKAAAGAAAGAAVTLTLVHGDFKAANFFFAAQNSGSDGDGDDGGGDRDTAIDFQWSGAGRGAADLAYLLSGAVAFEALDEAALLDHYHAVLTRRLAASPAPALVPSRAELQDAFEEELAAYWTTAMPYLLSDLSPELCAQNLAKHGFLTHEDDERVTAHISARVLGIARRWREEKRFG